MPVPYQAANMQSKILILTSIACIISTANANPAKLGARQDCGSNYSKCSPSGATTTNIPAVGGALSGLYVDVLDSVNGVKFSKRGAQELAGPLGKRASSATVCCTYCPSHRYCVKQKLIAPLGADGTTCLTLANIDAPFCYVSTSI